jgi:hypothetical protein
LADREALIRLAPALGTTLLIALTLRRFRSPFALPLLLLALPLGFYGVLWAAGLTLEDARDAGWVTKPQASGGRWAAVPPPFPFFWGTIRRGYTCWGYIASILHPHHLSLCVADK